MDIFIDTADLDQIREAYSWGIVDGVTTNPSLIKKAADQLRESGDNTTISGYIEKILEVARGTPVSLEVIGGSAEELYKQGMILFDRFNGVAENVVVKIPVNPDMGNGSESWEGLKAIKRLAANGVHINTTLVFTPEQALLAAKAGSTYVSPFAGRIDDSIRKAQGGDFDKMAYFPAGGDGEHHDNGISSGVELIASCVDVLSNAGSDCNVLAASLRNPQQVRECALVGAQVSTIPFGVLRGMIEHPLTMDGMKAFTNDVVPEYRAVFE